MVGKSKQPDLLYRIGTGSGLYFISSNKNNVTLVMERPFLSGKKHLQRNPSFEELSQEFRDSPLFPFYDPAIYTRRKTERQHSDIVRMQEARAVLGGRPLTKKEIGTLLGH